MHHRLRRLVPAAVVLGGVAALGAVPAAAQAAQEITIRMVAPESLPGPVVARITKGTCTVKGSGAKRQLLVGGNSTDGRYHLDVVISGYRGAGRTYEILAGRRKPAAFDLYAPKDRYFSSLSADPGRFDVVVGGVGLRSGGRVLRFAGVAGLDGDPAAGGVSLRGGMRCT